MLHCPQTLAKATKSKIPASAIFLATSAHVLNFSGTGNEMSPVYFVLLRAGSEIRYHSSIKTEWRYGRPHDIVSNYAHEKENLRILLCGRGLNSLFWQF